MNLHGIVSGAINAVNPFITATLTPCTGYTTVNFQQAPSYGAPTTAQIQVQALTTRDLQHMDGLNIQGNMRKVWMNGNWNGIVRPGKGGGDLLSFNGQNWLITIVLEQWPDWTSAVVTLQE